MLVTEKRKSGIPYVQGQAKVALTSENSYCGEYAKVGICSNNSEHRYIKVIYCGKEWCKNCREITHNRRIARWLPKALTMESFGYFVFTIPLEMREFYRDKKNLSQLRTYLRKRLRQIYPDIKALCRWHWFGDDPYRYHPHLNVMVDSFEELSREQLERIKQDYGNALQRFTRIRLDKKINVHYQYYSPGGLKAKYKSLTDEQAEKLYQKVLWHKLKYITRATFTVYDRDLAEKLKNYRNSSVWGRFPELSYEEVEKIAKEREAHSKVSQDVILLEAGYCPKCGGRIHWSKGLFPGSLSFYGKEIGNGYFELPTRIRGSPNWLKE